MPILDLGPTPAESGLCAPWATLDDVDCGPCAEYGPDPSPYFEFASEILFDLTEHAYPGVCEDTIRPPSTCGCGILGRADWSPLGFGGYPWGCACQHVSEVTLPGWPVRSITQVLIDGTVVNPDRYRVDQHRRLVYQPDTISGGTDQRWGWPLFQRVEQPPTEPGTWQVTYTYGTDPPAGGRRAAAIYACEIALACTPGFEDRCRLPSNTVTVTSKNVAKVIADPDKLRNAGETGLPEVDAWIRANRWGRQNRTATVLAPRSKPKHTRRTS